MVAGGTDGDDSGGIGRGAFEGPRRMRMDEVVASERLFRACFGAPALEDEAGVLARYVPPREGGMYVIAHEGRLVAQIDTFHDRIKVYDGEIRVGSVGGVCTHPEYRERRLAGRLMEYCAQELVDGGANLLLISGGRGLYTRLGNVPHGRFLSFAITSPQSEQLPAAEEACGAQGNAGRCPGVQQAVCCGTGALWPHVCRFCEGAAGSAREYVCVCRPLDDRAHR